MPIFPTVPSFLFLALAVAGQNNEWVSFTDETATRLITSPERGAQDVAEKDFAFGDIDNDGDLDVVVVRKTEFGSPCLGSALCQNQLLINEGLVDGHDQNGVFVDRTEELATEADDGGAGFFDITNDRDVELVDVNGDGWLDVVTAAAVSDGLPKTISHPRIYINKGEADGVWQGLAYEEQRIPQLFTMLQEIPVAPRFSSVSAGDVDGDGDQDLYFVDHDNSVTSPAMPAGHDLNDRLLINDGAGFFTDSLETRMSSTMLKSAYGVGAVIADMNDDGTLDIVKATTLQNPQYVSISYNLPGNEGYFSGFSVIYPEYEGAPGAEPYFVTSGDVNNDNLVDLIVTDHHTDAYSLSNLGNDAESQAQFLTTLLETDDPSGYGGNTVVADLDRDGFDDVLVANINEDWDHQGSGRLHIYRNQGDIPDVTLLELGGSRPWTPEDAHDVIALEIDGDGWLDLFIGTWNGNSVWINKPPLPAAPSAQGAGPRYLEIDAEAQPGEFAIHVVGDPEDASVACVAGYIQANGSLNEIPLFLDAWSWGGSVFAADEAIVPGTIYLVQFDVGSPGSPDLGPATSVSTFAWGDVDQNQVVNFADLLLIVQAFQGNFANVTLQATDMAPCTANGIVNFEDILAGVMAFQGSSYSESGCALPCTE